jgi:formamidase
MARFTVRKGEAADKNIRDLRFTREDYYLPPEFAAPRRFFATTGISVTKDGVNHSEDITLAARNALLNMIEHVTERGWTRQQAYAICGVAVDLKISQLVRRAQHARVRVPAGGHFRQLTTIGA